MLGIKESLPQVFVQLTTQPGMTYEELKRAIKASSSYLTSELERRQEAMAFQATDSHRSAPKLDSNQCAYCLKRNHRWRQCRRYISGKPPAKRPAGMAPPRNFPPPENAHGDTKDGRAFMAFTVSTEEIGGEVMLASSSSTEQISFLCDSGANVHMTPWLEDLSNTRTINRSCTFGNRQ